MEHLTWFLLRVFWNLAVLVGTQYLWWLLSAGHSVFKVCNGHTLVAVVVCVCWGGGYYSWDHWNIWFLILFCPFPLVLLLYFPYLSSSLDELQVNYNNDRSRWVGRPLFDFYIFNVFPVSVAKHRIFVCTGISLILTCLQNRKADLPKYVPVSCYILLELTCLLVIGDLYY